MRRDTNIGARQVALSRLAALFAPRGIPQLRDLVFSFDPSEADAR
jgi:hypothetical protein